jgi:hypothetical protein
MQRALRLMLAIIMSLSKGGDALAIERKGVFASGIRIEET